MTQLNVIDNEDICTCSENECEEHLCPFRLEINEDDTPCACCDHCRRKCAEEI